MDKIYLSLADMLSQDRRVVSDGRTRYGLEIKITTYLIKGGPIYIYCFTSCDRRSLKDDLEAWSSNLEVKTFKPTGLPKY